MKSDITNEELRYLEYFGLEYNPFPVAPDNENFYISEHIDQILTELVHGIVARKGFMVLTGEIGLGKTTISRRIINILEEKGVETSLILHTFYQDVELLREINKDFGLYSDSLELSDQMKVLNDFLINKNRESKNCAIIIDDAQNLNSKSLELIRMISNLETDREKLVQVLLIGQPELMNKLNSPELRQLKSRIIIKEEAQPLSQNELKNYILFKLNTAGNQGRTTIATGAFRKIHKYSKGNFRGVNIFMDRCLYVAFIHNTTDIVKSIVNEAHRDLNQTEQKRGGKTFRFSLLALLVLLVGGAFYLNLFPKINLLQSNTSTREETVISGEKREAFQTADTQVLEEKIQKKTPIPEAIVNFLSAYNLSEFAMPFFEAMATGIFKEVADSIYTKTGYNMIQLETIPEHIKSRYGVLSISLNKSGKENHFLLWRPTIRITKFYLGYRGEEIKRLEKLLAKVNQYLYYIDGIVGPRLIMALNRFQEEKGLDVSGFPDERTIFLLCNAQDVVQPVTNSEITKKIEAKTANEQ